MRVLCVVGTRPEGIKMAPVIQALRACPAGVEAAVCSTGQHREMLAQVLSLFEIHVDFDLDLMEARQTLPSLTARLIEGLDGVLADFRPDWLLAQGDTTTVLASGLAAFYRRCRFGHVEAGLRTGDRRSPFPEEVNRRVASVVADIHFAPTQRSREALLRENVPECDIVVTGNTVVDAVLAVAARPYSWESGPLAFLPQRDHLVLVTAHRRESFGAPLRELCGAIRDLAIRFERGGFHFVYPVHLNPNVREPVYEMLGGIPNVSLLPPLDYVSIVQLMRKSRLILTDSGGIQEEAPSFGVPVLVMRDKTERPEGVEAGLVELVGTDRQVIVEAATRHLVAPKRNTSVQAGANPYGDGHAAERIVAALVGRHSK